MTTPGYVHDLLIENPAGHTTDALGGTSEQFAAAVPVRGVAAMISFREASAAAQQGLQLDAVARVPAATTVSQGARVTVPDVAGAPLAGVYRVQAVRWNPLDLRLMMSRTVFGGQDVTAANG